jgi:hypothetical protein
MLLEPPCFVREHAMSQNIIQFFSILSMNKKRNTFLRKPKAKVRTCQSRRSCIH